MKGVFPDVSPLEEESINYRAERETALLVSTTYRAGHETALLVSTPYRDGRETALLVSTTYRAGRETALLVSTTYRAGHEAALLVSTTYRAERETALLAAANLLTTDKSWNRDWNRQQIFRSDECPCGTGPQTPDRSPTLPSPQHWPMPDVAAGGRS